MRAQEYYCRHCHKIFGCKIGKIFINCNICPAKGQINCLTVEVDIIKDICDKCDGALIALGGDSR